MKYRVKKKKTHFNADATWDGPPWKGAPVLSLTHYMGPGPDHFPRTKAKLIFDDEFVFVLFRVEDQYVRAVAEHHQENVFEDSCVEFFFTPGPDVSRGYFNLEMNCGGTMLFHFQTERGRDKVIIPPAPGVQWRANFYKCGDRTSHPHWFTWSPVEASKPDFHRPECFGILEFE